MRFFVFGLLVVYFARYTDLYLIILDPLIGRKVFTSAGAMQFHARVGFVMGVFILALCFANLLISYRFHFLKLRYQRSTSHPNQADIAFGRHLQNIAKAELPPPVGISPAEQSLRETIRRWRLLHDVVWGWPFLLALSLLFFGCTLDGSPVPPLIETFHWPALDFFTKGRTPVSALNGIFFGALAYGANHALSKTSYMPLTVKLVLNACFGVLAILAWYTLTTAMGAPTGLEKILANLGIEGYFDWLGQGNTWMWVVILGGFCFPVSINIVLTIKIVARERKYYRES
jgi:hypothetical protein